MVELLGGREAAHAAERECGVNITEIRITLRDDNKLKGFASITLDDAFVIRGLKIIDGSTGPFVAMPSRKRKDGTFQDIAHPINMETREWMEHQVIAAYKQEVQRAESGQFPGDDGNDKGPGSMMEESY
jgi:stage V sporulation protein G